jgi:hypothetical protein
MSWVERTPGRWRAAYRDPDGGRRSHTFDTKAAAKAFLAAMETDIQRGQWIDPRGGEVPFAEWADRWLAARVVRPTTLASDAVRLRRHLLPAFGGLSLKSIMPLTTVRSWVAQLSAAGPGRPDGCAIPKLMVVLLPVSESPGPSTLNVDSPTPARTTMRSAGSAEGLLSRCTAPLGT